ncbi:hypothetical protein MPTK2_2g19850 [Marchantia polymorpha subsp. ruderalis]
MECGFGVKRFTLEGKCGRENHAYREGSKHAASSLPPQDIRDHPRPGRGRSPMSICGSCPTPAGVRAPEIGRRPWMVPCHEALIPAGREAGPSNREPPGPTRTPATRSIITPKPTGAAGPACMVRAAKASLKPSSPLAVPPRYLHSLVRLGVRISKVRSKPRSGASLFLRRSGACASPLPFSSCESFHERARGESEGAAAPRSRFKRF